MRNNNFSPMKTPKIFCQVALFAFTAFVCASCLTEEDPGALQFAEKDFALLDFDRLDMGDAFVISVQESPIFTVHVHGDRRNIDDLVVTKAGTTLKIGYSSNRNRTHTTYIDITMPALLGASLSGATNSTIYGFKSSSNIDLILTGASIAQFSVESKKLTLNLSGASKLTLSGKSDDLSAKVSGASELYSYALTATQVDADVSGASKVNVLATQSLHAVASGASVVYYRGNPNVNSTVSGASVVQSD
jgi:hypothetical protein